MQSLARRGAAALMPAVMPTVVLAVGADKAPWKTDCRGLALAGPDQVAYATDGKAVRGRLEFEHRWQSAKWHFDTAPHRDELARAPEQFEPRLRGYSACPVSPGYTADVHQSACRNVDGRFHLNCSKRAQPTWEKDVPGNSAKGAANGHGVSPK